MITYTIKGKTVGQFSVTKQTLYKRVKESKHLFRKMDAWGIDARVMDRLPEGAKIEIRDSETRTIYTTYLPRARSHGAFHHFKEAKEDHGTQFFIPRSVFTKTNF